ncbi:MAG TPA: hypothetical protein VFQ81_07985 [Candidatus Limnocylindria bacterium]|nr:hypothetical protein [Candidatus Limnocylindria bacterium]
MGLLRVAWLVLILCACAPRTDAPAATPGSFEPTPAVVEDLALPDGTPVRSWGDGPYGVVLVGDGWDPLAAELALHGMRLVAVAPDALEPAITWLHDEGIERVAVMAVGGPGVQAAFELGTDAPELVDQLITISARGDVARLGEFPKLFVASEGEGAAAQATDMADQAAGEWNAALLVPGDASELAILEGDGADELRSGILRRLEERR